MPASREPLSLASPRLLFEPHGPADFADFHRLATHPEVTRYITGGVPFREEQSRAFVERQQAHFARHGYCRWKLTHRETGQYMGLCGAEIKHLDGETAPEIGWWIAREFWGAGYASEAARYAFDHLWQVIQLPRLTSCAYPENVPSIRVMEKLGLSFEKYFDEVSPITGERLHLVMYSIVRQAASG